MAAKNKPTDKDPAESGNRTSKYDYVLGWIDEAIAVRGPQNGYVQRAVSAYQTMPSANRYKGTISSYVTSVQKHDQQRAKDIQTACGDVPDKGSLVVQNAVEAVVSMTQGGVGQYQFGAYDPSMKADPELVDRLAAYAKFFYDSNKIDSLMPQLVRNAALCGVAYLHLKQKNGQKVVTLMDSAQMLTDPKRFKTNHERFIGYTQRESFRDVKNRIHKTKGGGYVLKTLNEAEVYVAQLKQELNSVLRGNPADGVGHEQLRRDLDIFYKPIYEQFKAARANNNDPDLMYDGDEIEVSYVYDKMNGQYFEVINRKYVVVAKSQGLKRDITIHYLDAEGKDQTKQKTIKLDDPFVELPYNKLFWNTYPVSPLFYVLDDFDDLCAMESLLYHNLSIMAPLTFVGQSSDAEKVSRVASISGEVVEGLPQTFGVLKKDHDITPVVTAIQRYEERVKRAMKAVDPFELQGMIGDRATAKEVSSASGQVSQGLNPFIANIETAMATLGDKFIKLELILNDDDSFSFSHNGEQHEISREEMAHDFMVHAKLQSTIKLEREANAMKATQLIQYLGQLEAVDKKEFLGTMIPIVLSGLVTREQAQKMVLPAYRPMPDEVIAAIKRRAEEEAQKDEADSLDLSGYSPEELDQMTSDIMSRDMAEQPPEQAPPEPPLAERDFASQAVPEAGPGFGQAPGAAVSAPAPGGPSAGQSPDMAGLTANEQIGLGYQ
jgi:hypothetical protein